MFKRKPKKKSELDLILDEWDECKDTYGEFYEEKVRMFVMLNAPGLYKQLCWASARRSVSKEIWEKTTKRLR